MATQKQKVLRHIISQGSISPAEALRDYQITRLAARILDLKNDGIALVSEIRKHPVTGVRYARYSLDPFAVSHIYATRATHVYALHWRHG